MPLSLCTAAKPTEMFGFFQLPGIIFGWQAFFSFSLFTL